MKKSWFVIGLLVLLVMLTVGAVLANDSKTIHVKESTLTDHECDSTEWHFVINQISEEASAPSSIHVAWANGASENVSMWKFTGGVAHYVTSSNLNSTVTEASAEIYAEWSGQFNLSSGPCLPLCAEVDTHYGAWGPWSPWSECIDGVQSRTRTREVWTTDKNHPEVECNRRVETETQTQWCELCEEFDTHYGEWGPWSEWSDCADGKKTRTRTREVWTTDVNHPSVECDRRVETETQTIDCALCVEVDTHVGPWSEWSEWSECVDGKQSRTRTREVWTTDKYHPEIECDRRVETETESRGCEEPTPTPTPIPEPASCNQPPTEAGCKEGLGVYKGLCRNLSCPEELDCICPPPACYPRLNIYALDCVPEGLVISCYFEFDEDNFDTPSGKKYIDKPWEKNPFIVDLDKDRALRCWGWTAEGGFDYFFDVSPIRQCPKVIDKEHRFPCPEPPPTLPPPPEVVELPVTGTGPPLATQATQGVNPVSLVGLALAAIGTYLRRRG